MKQVKLFCQYVAQKAFIKNNSLEELYFELYDYESDKYQEMTEIKLETPNLKVLKFEKKIGDPISLEFIFQNSEAEILDLEKIRIENITVPYIGSTGSKIKIKELIMLNTPSQIDHRHLTLDCSQLEYLLGFVFPDSIKKLVLVDEYLNITDLIYLEKLKNLTELSLFLGNVIDLTGIENLENLQKLHISSPTLGNIDNIDKLKNVSSLGLYGAKINDYSALKNMKNLKELTVHYSALERLPNLEQLEQLYVIVELFENKTDTEKNLQRKLNGRFKNAKVSFCDSKYIFNDNKDED